MKQAQNMTIEEAKNFFEQLKYMLNALPKDKAEQVLNDTCEAFFKTFSLERNDFNMRILQPRMSYNLRLEVTI